MLVQHFQDSKQITSQPPCGQLTGDQSRTFDAQGISIDLFNLQQPTIHGDGECGQGLRGRAGFLFDHLGGVPHDEESARAPPIGVCDAPTNGAGGQVGWQDKSCGHFARKGGIVHHTFDAEPVGGTMWNHITWYRQDFEPDFFARTIRGIEFSGLFRRVMQQELQIRGPVIASQLHLDRCSRFPSCRENVSGSRSFLREQGRIPCTDQAECHAQPEMTGGPNVVHGDSLKISLQVS